MTRFLTVARDRSDAESHGSSREHVERLALRERTLVGSIRRIRVQLGLPEVFDPEHERARLGQEDRLNGRTSNLRRRDSTSPTPTSSDRPRVRPVPAPRPGRIERDRTGDVLSELVSYAARYWGRKAAEELLEHRASPARGYLGRPIVVWPKTRLARTANGQVYGGSAGPLMGELVGRAFDGDESNRHAAIAVASYVEEFTACVTTALTRERVIAAQLGQLGDVESIGRPSSLRRELAQAACERIAVEVRAARRIEDVTAAEVASVAGLDEGV